MRPGCASGPSSYTRLRARLGGKAKDGTPFWRVFGPQPPPLGLDDGAADCQPQPQPLFLGGDKGLKDALSLVRRDAMTVIGDRALERAAVEGAC